MPANFSTPSTATQVAHDGLPFAHIKPIQVLSLAADRVTMKSGNVHITATSAGAYTIAAPDIDGQVITIISETAFAHVFTCPIGFNGKNSSGTATFAAAVDNGMQLNSRNGQWWASGTANVTYA